MPGWRDRAVAEELPKKSSWRERALPEEEAEAQKSAEEEGGVTTGLNKFAQGASFGLTDELGGAMEAVGSKLGVRGLGGKISDVRRETPEEDSESFSDVYTKRRDQNRLRQKGENLAYPKLSTAAEIGGGITSGMMTGNPSSLLGKIGAGAADSALQGFGNSEGKTAGDIAKDTAVAGTLGAGTAGVFGGAGKLADKTGLSDLAQRALLDPVADAASSLKNKLMSFANERAVKAVYGQNKRAFKELERGGRIQKAGEDLLATDEAGKPVVGWLTKSEEALPRIQAKKKYFGEEIGDVGKTVDDVLPGAVDGQDIAQSALEHASSKIPDASLFEPQRNKLLQLGQDYEGKNLSWQEAQALKNSLKFNPLDPGTSSIGKEATNELNRSVSGAMDKAVDKAVVAPGVTPEQAEKLKLYSYLKSKYQTHRGAALAGQDRATANLSNRFVSPSDMFVGGIMGGAGMINNPQDSLGTGALAVTGALANKAFRGRGSAFSANAAKSVADFIGSGTSAAQKFGPYLQKILQEQGPENAATALYLIMKNDPQTRDKVLTEGTPK